MIINRRDFVGFGAAAAVMGLPGPAWATGAAPANSDQYYAPACNKHQSKTIPGKSPHVE